MKKIWIAKDGFPVEHIEGRWFLNWIRDRIHGRTRMTAEEFERSSGIRLR
jgi:hypothetical protein